ncbi:MAG: T9SS type A sorting domain-containing protein [Bacteroidetes bacterium]|nr:T9SS type A sorting domain-containing protein [Bacteroidota bacterium]
MNNNIRLIFIFIIISGWLQAQYTTPGTGVVWDMDDLVTTSGGVVTLNGEIYVIASDITVSSSDTIRQLSDAEIHLMQTVLITVHGVLEFSPPETIVISANDTTLNFKGFRFEDSDHSFMERCIIQFGGGIKLVNSDIRIENCTIRKFDKSNCTGTIDLFGSSPEILNCDISLNQGPAILSAANGESSPYIKGNWIYRNNTENTNMPQINLGTSEPEKDIIIRDNFIEGFYDKAGGIAVTTLAGGYLSCVIDSNTIINNRYGITVYGFDINSVISNNILADNNIENLPMQGGSGINFWGGTSNISMVHGNKIYGNLWGITNTGDAMPNLGQVEPDTINPGKNLIYENENLGTTYALYNNTPNNIFAENNYWGSYDPDSVEAVIYHYPDDESLGFVDYIPFKDFMTGLKEKSVSPPSLLIYPNPSGSQINLDIQEAGTLIIFNSTGDMVLETSVSTLDLVDVTTLPAGVYFTCFANERVTLTGKFIKE